MILGLQEYDYINDKWLPVHKHNDSVEEDFTPCEFDELNYLECNYNAYFEEPRRQIWF